MIKLVGGDSLPQVFTNVADRVVQQTMVFVLEEVPDEGSSHRLRDAPQHSCRGRGDRSLFHTRQGWEQERAPVVLDRFVQRANWSSQLRLCDILWIVREAGEVPPVVKEVQA